MVGVYDRQKTVGTQMRSRVYLFIFIGICLGSQIVDQKIALADLSIDDRQILDWSKSNEPEAPTYACDKLTAPEDLQACESAKTKADAAYAAQQKEVDDQKELERKQEEARQAALVQIQADQEKQKQDDTARLQESNQPKQNYVLKKVDDVCSSTIQSMLVKEAVKHMKDNNISNPSRDEIVAWLNDSDDGKRLREDYTQKYGCDADKSLLDFVDEFNAKSGIVTQVAAGVAGGIATYKVQDAASDPTKNLTREAHNAMADTMFIAGGTQFGMGVMQLSAGLSARGVMKRQKNAANEVSSFDESADMAARTGTLNCAATQTKDGGNTEPLCKNDLTTAGAVSASLDAVAQANEDAAKKYNEDGKTYSGKSLDTHQKIQAGADALQKQTLFQAASSMIQGASSIAMSIITRCDKDSTRPECGGGTDLTPPPVLNGDAPDLSGGNTQFPGLVPGGVGGGNDTTPPPIIDNSARYAGLNSNGPTRFPAGGDSVGGNKLASMPAPHKGNLVPGTGTGAAGGGTGGGSGGGAGGGNSSSKDRQSSQGAGMLASSKKFGDAIAGGGAGFGSSGGASKRVDGTNMDMSGMNGMMNQLSALLPNNKKEKEENNILNFGSRSPASIGEEIDDGSILGRNSNLFARINTKTMTYYTKGFSK